MVTVSPPTDLQTPAAKPRRSRAGALGMPKTRGGCFTCKSRRVKCDEEKPYCLRCRRFDRKCEGYLENPNKRKSRRSDAPKGAPRSLLPASTMQPSHCFEGLGSTEYRYFQAFRFETVPELSSVFNVRLWSRIVLQACHSAPFVRQAAIALGALQKSLMYGDEVNVATAGSISEEKAEHYCNALLHYSKAVKAMRETVHDQKKDTRMILIGCLLVLCFEGSQGNLSIANAHAQSGYRLYLESKKSSLIHVEDDIVQAFKMLQIIGLASTWIYGKTEPTIVEELPLEVVEGSTTAWSTAEEAYQSWESIVRYSVNYLHIATSQFANTGTTEHDHFEKVAEHQGRIKEWLVQVQKLKYSLPDDAKIDLIPLEMGIRALDTDLRSIAFSNLCSYDIFISEYRKIVALSSNYLIGNMKLGRRRKAKFNINLSPLPGLIEVVKSCRDQQIRREAIRMLSSLSCKQGLLDSQLAAKMGTWIMEVEEMRMVNGCIPESARMKSIKMNVNARLKIAVLEGVRVEEGGKQVIERTVIALT